MTTPNPVHDPADWETRYKEGRTGWERGVPTPAFVALLDGASAVPPGRLAAPGCGRGHDALLFAEHGFEVVGFDFAPSAVEGATELARRKGFDAQARFEQADVFTLHERYPEAFDYVLERACFCAIAPADRDRYVTNIRAILKPGGRLIASFFIGPAEGGPPFAADWEVIKAHFAPWFEVDETHEPEFETPMDGADLFAILRRIA